MTRGWGLSGQIEDEDEHDKEHEREQDQGLA